MEKKFNYIIGDIHGCFDELLELEEKITEHSARHNVSPFIIACGDLVDRGLYSKQVLEHFINGTKLKTHISVIGNHELMMLQAFECFAPKNFDVNFPTYFDTYKEVYQLNKGYLKNLSWDSFKITMKGIWVGQGGNETLDSFGIDPDDFSTWKISSQIISYLSELPVYYEGDNFIVTHALAKKEDIDIIKNYNKNKKYDDLSLELKKAFSTSIWNRNIPEEKIYNKIHLSGHTPLKKVKRLRKANALQLDTGCVFGNKLTAYCVETNSFISISSKTHYS